MISLTNYLSRNFVLIVAGLLLFGGCGGSKESARREFHPRETKFPIAVFPIENLTGTAAPLEEVRKSLILQLNAGGFQVLEEEVLARFMARNRVRFIGGIDSETAQALKKETGAEGVLITSLELYSEANPPKIGLTSRLVSTGENPSILWIDGVGLAGDDSPGFLGLGLVEDPKDLLKRAIESITGGLGKYLSAGEEREDIKKARRKFQPKSFYRSEVIVPEKKYTIAIIPFFNRSDRKYAGEIMTLHFVKEMKKFSEFEIIELGVVRKQLLTLRVVMEEGISIAQTEALLSTLFADLVLTGRVMDYQDYQGTYGTPKVDFSAQLIERKSRMVIWSSISYNRGDDGVFFFDRGRVNTAYAMTSQMIQSIGEKLLKGKKSEKPLSP
jgi:TolB-like protein